MLRDFNIILNVMKGVVKITFIEKSTDNFVFEEEFFLEDDRGARSR